MSVACHSSDSSERCAGAYPPDRMIGDLIKIKVEELPNRRPRKKPFFRRSWVKFSLLALVLLSLGGYIGAQLLLKPFREKAATYDLSLLGKLEESSIVFDRNGKELGRLATENRQLVAYGDIPLHFIEALIATEDSRFWEHHGVDWKGVARASFWNTIQGQNRQGASTITQQLARQTFREYAKTLDRKITEVYLAERIELVHTKPQILELYLNRIYLGSGFHGIGAAAQGYFSKDVKDLTLEDSAIIVGLIKNPSRYSPISGQKELTLRERNEVYDRMVVTHKLTSEAAAALKIKPLAVNPSENIRAFGYLQQEVINEVETILEQQGYEGIGGKGFKIHTTVDSVIQRAAEASMTARLAAIEALPDYPKAPGRETPAQFAKILADLRAAGNPAVKAPTPAYLQGAAIVIDNKTGAVLGMVGGREFKESQFNRVTLSKRPAGTVFTPFVYATAFEGQQFPGSRLVDKQMDNTRIMIGATTGTLGEWGMETLQGVHEGEISLRQAFAEGKNNSAARLGLDLGSDKVRDFAKRAGLGDLGGDPSMLLGRSEVSVRDLALAYTTFANAGVRPASTSLVTRIENAAGQPVYVRPANSYQQVRVTDPVTAWMVHSCLEDALAVGTGAPAVEYGLKDFPAAGKTGTHSKSTDLWFAGYTPDVTCVVWTGLDRKETVYPDAFSNRVALPVWTDIMNATRLHFPGTAFPAPAGIQQVELCTVSGKLATEACLELRPDPADPTRNKLFKSSYLEYIRSGFRLTQLCDFHSKSNGNEPPRIQIEEPPVIGASGGIGVSPDAEEAVPVRLKAPTVLGKDPYESNFGVEVLIDPTKPPRAIPVKDTPKDKPAPPKVPIYQPGADPLTPRPDRIQID